MRIVLVLLGALAVATSGYGEEEAAPAVEYVAMQPKFVVNLQGRRRYLRADVQLLVAGEDNVEKIKTHLPAIRHSLIMLFSNLAPDRLETADQRESLRQKALEQARETLDKYADSSGLKDLFFTEFLVQ